MIPTKIENVFIEIKTDFNGIIKEIVAGSFVKKEFPLNTSIYNPCPFLEGTLDALTENNPFLIEGMVVSSHNKEFNVDLELFKDQNGFTVLIHNRTNVYKIVDQLNQNRNDIFFIKRELNEKNKELKKLRAIADKASEEKSRFLAVMSHEIRNPLNSILGYTEMILAEELSENVKNHAKFLSMAGQNLKVIVNDVLDISRIEAGVLELAEEPISINEIVEFCVSDFKNRPTKTTIEIDVKQDIIKDLVLGDSVRITQILSNLLNNAIKFTSKGGVYTFVNILKENKNQFIVEFLVKDTGRGMTKEQSEKIFEEYHQNELDDNRSHGGAGLGLSIVKRLLEAMDGEISVESELNIGTTFKVIIPFKKAEFDSLKNTVSNQQTNDTLEGKIILFADDDLLNQKIVSHFLEKEKAKVQVVNNGLEAESEIKKSKFDLIVLDINMPFLKGDELIEKNDYFKVHNAKTPIIALTGNTSLEDVNRYLKLGFSKVISKPYTSESFIKALKSVL